MQTAKYGKDVKIIITFSNEFSNYFSY